MCRSFFEHRTFFVLVISKMAPAVNKNIHEFATRVARVRLGETVVVTVDGRAFATRGDRKFNDIEWWTQRG